MNPEAASWRTAASDPGITASLEAIFERCAAAIAQRGPACWASGRCCRFETVGHRLYVTGLEAAYCLARLEAPLTPERLDAALQAGGCPFQNGHLCGIQAIKPLGCRIYFCDQSAQDWQHDLSERLLADIRALHEGHELPYRYGEWRAMLRQCL